LLIHYIFFVSDIFDADVGAANYGCWIFRDKLGVAGQVDSLEFNFIFLSLISSMQMLLLQITDAEFSEISLVLLAK
jgi:hypothetical protein